MSKNKFYILTSNGKVYFNDIPENVHVTTLELSQYTGNQVGACWVEREQKLYRLFHVENDFQVIKLLL